MSPIHEPKTLDKALVVLFLAATSFSLDSFMPKHRFGNVLAYSIQVYVHLISLTPTAIHFRGRIGTWHSQICVKDKLQADL
uniref:Uncharacterized protein n=1 Tax=Picea sitchensis TaxID=3332 RepID=D5ADZ8_PICSI|nr:unknown [Picea sitchensis]